MKPAVLIVNPAAGRAGRLAAQLPAIEALLAARGYTAQVLYTSAAANSAGDLALAAAPHAALVFACGGDGAVHGVVQTLAYTGVPLGVLPLGTANALARNLGLSLDPLAALAKQLSWTPRAIPLGEMTTAHGKRLFVAMAGCGPDGALVQSLSAAHGSLLKRRFGRTAYYAHAARLFLTRRWPAFRVEFRPAGASTWQSLAAVAMIAARIPDLGGLFSHLTRRASLTGPHLHVQLLRPPAQLSLPAWIACARAGLPNPWLTTVDVQELRCAPYPDRPYPDRPYPDHPYPDHPGQTVYAQADAEPLGTLPVALRVLPAALTLLMPRGMP